MMHPETLPLDMDLTSLSLRTGTAYVMLLVTVERLMLPFFLYY